MSERQRKPPPNRAEAGGELGHVRIISYNIQVSVLITFHRFLIVNYRVRRVDSREHRGLRRVDTDICECGREARNPNSRP